MRRRQGVLAATVGIVVVSVLATGGLVARAATGTEPADRASGVGTALSALRTTWPQSTTVDHVRVVGSGPDWQGSLDFGDGSSLDLAPGSTGVVDTGFPARTVDSAVLTVTGSDLAIESWSVDRSAPSTTVSASSSDSTTELAALSDGSVADGRAGAAWTAAATDATPWIRWAFPDIRRIASVQLLGPAARYTDPAATGSAALNGTLVFSDGSRVPVSGIGSGADAPTTVAFAPRATSSVRLELSKTIPQAVVSLREVSLYDAGTTPPRWPAAASGNGTAQPVAASGCATRSAAVGSSSDGSPALVCPATGSRVDGATTVVVQVAAGAAVTASARVPDASGATGVVRAIATATADATGRAALSFDSTTLARGPFAVRVTAAGVARALYVQLDNARGIGLTATGSVPAGMALRFDESFTSALSASERGVGTEYMTKKPESWGGSDFGGAEFASPESGAGTVTTVDSDFLRLRVRPMVSGETDASGWGRTMKGGLLSSLRVGATGFSAQYGYFEARILGAPGTGTWPAFWAMSTEGATSRSTSQGEADAVELYGHDTSGSCRTTHNWSKADGDSGGETDCRALAGFDDWALAWHTYGVRITPTATEYFVDGTRVSTQAAMKQNAEPFFFMLDLTTDGGWPTDLSPTGGVSDMYVDWVHVYT